MSKIIGSVEIGTSQAKALVGEASDNGNLRIIGMASRPNEGMRKGEIVDFRKVASSVHAAIAEAEKMSGTTIDSVYLARSGSHLKGRMLHGSAYVSSSDNRVTTDDLERASEEATAGKPVKAEIMCTLFALPSSWTDRSGMTRLGCTERKSILVTGRSMGTSNPCALPSM